MKIEIDEFYSMERITGVVVEFKLLAIDQSKRSFEMELINTSITLKIEDITENELRTIKKIKAPIIKNG